MRTERLKAPHNRSGVDCIPERSYAARLISPRREISVIGRAELKVYLEGSVNPFSVATVPSSRKGKKSSAPLEMQTDLWEDRLSVQYEIKPWRAWKSMRRYNKFRGKLALGRCSCYIACWQAFANSAQLVPRASQSGHVYWLNTSRTRLHAWTSPRSGKPGYSRSALSITLMST